MCLAIFKPAKARIPKRYLRNGFDNNNDGAGFAVALNGKVEVFKGFFTFSDFYKAFKLCQDKTAIIHFRMTTHGLTNDINCHPFSLLGGEYAMIHNGVLDIECVDKSKSDTAHYAELVIEPLLQTNKFDGAAFKFLVEQAIGGANKIVILKGDGSHCIYNEAKGEWHDGVWYSNSGYRAQYCLSNWRDWTAKCGFSFNNGSTREGILTEYGKEKFPDWNGPAYQGPMMDDFASLTEENYAQFGLTYEDYLELEADASAERAAKFSERRDRLMLTQAEQDALENERYSG